MTTKKRKLERQDEPMPKKTHLESETVVKDNFILVDDIRNSKKHIDVLRFIATHGEESVKEFVSTGGKSNDITMELDLIDKAKPPLVQAIFEASEKFIVYAPSAFASELVHNILHDHMSYIITYLSQNSPLALKKTVLRLLTTMVATGNESSAKDLLLKLNFDHIYFEQLFLAEYNEGRKAYIYFLLSFFISQSPPIIKEFIDKGGKRLAEIFNGLHKDSVELVLFVMEVLKDKLMMNSNISKTSKMKIFNTSVLKRISNLLCNDNGWTDDDASNVMAVKDSIMEFLITSLTSPKTGLIFLDESVGNSGQNRNLLLLTFLQTLKTPWENERWEKIVITCLSKCPDQLRPYLNSLSPSAPRDSNSWFKISNFFRVLMNEIELESKVMSSSMNKKFLIATLSNVAFPEVIIKEVVKPALKASLPVQRSGIDILIDLVYKVEDLLWKTEKAGVTGSSIRTQLIRRFKERIPPLDDILSFWKYEMSVSELDGEYLCKTAKILDFYLNFLRLECDAVENLLSDIQKLNKSVETNKATLFFLKYQASSFTIKNHFNDNYIEILFNVALKSEDENLRNLSTTTLYQIFGIQNGLTKRSVEFEIFLSVCRETDLSYSTIIQILNPKNYIVSDLNDEILELKNKISQPEECSGLTRKNQIVEQFLDRLIDNDDDNVMDILHDTISPKNSLQNTINFELSPLTMIFLKSYNHSHHTWIIKYLRYLSYSQEDIENFILCVENFIKDENLTSHFNAFRFGGLNQLDDEKNIKIESLSALIIITKLSLMYKFNRRTQSEMDIINELKNLLNSSKDIRKCILTESQVLLNLFKPYSDKHSDLNCMILDVLDGNQCSTEQAVFKKRFLKDFKECDGLESISAELLDQYLKVFGFDPTDINCMMEVLIQGKKPDNANWLLHFTKLLLHHSDSLSTHSLKNMVEVIREAIRAGISSPRSNMFLSSFIGFFKKNLDFAINDLNLSDFVHPLLKKDEVPTDLLEFLVSNNINSSAKIFRSIISKDPNLLSSKWESLLTTLVASVKRKAKEKFVCETIVNTLSEAMNNSLLKNDNNCVFRELIIVILEHFPKLNMIEKLNLDFGSDFIPSLGTACCLMTMANNESLSSKHFANKVLIPCLKMYCQKLKDPSGLSVDQMQDCYNCFSKMLRFDLHKVMAYIVKRKTDFWINTVRIFLKHGLKMDLTLKANLRGLSIMSELIKFSYTEKHEHLTTIYEMINGHSNFLKLLLSMQAGEDVFSLMKKDLLLLINSIVSISPELVSQEHIPLYLGAYGSSLSQADQCILSILKIHEKKHSFASFQPIVWGSLAISRYTIGTSEKKNLWKVPRCSEILGLIDADKMYETAINFPIEMTLFNENTFYENDPSKYDPRFYLQLFSSLCSSERYIDKHLKLQEYGALALALASISSKDEDMRALGYTVLSRIFRQFEATKFAKEKMIWIHFFNLIRNGARESKNSKTDYLRIPSIVSVFLVRTVRILKNPLHYMYKPLSHFLLAKPFLDLFNVPDFLNLFHSIVNASESDDTPRKWILEVIEDGLKDYLDYYILLKVRIIRVLLSFNGSILSTNEEEIFNIIEKCLRLKDGALDLIQSQGFLIWCLSKRSSQKKCINLLRTSWNTISTDDSLLTHDLLLQFVCVIKGLLYAGYTDSTLFDLLGSILNKGKANGIEKSIFSKDEFLQIVPRRENVLDSFNNVLLIMS